MKRYAAPSSDGFAFLVPLLVIIVIILVGWSGYYIVKIAPPWARKSAASPSGTALGAPANSSVSTNLHAFYDCIDSVHYHVVTHVRPVTCTINGVKIELPTVFDASQIDELDYVPVDARPLIIAQARQRFTSCSQFSSFHNLPGIPQTDVSLAQSNFVAISYDCYYNGMNHAYGLNGGTWADLGDFQYLSCDWVDTYNIHQNAVIPLENLGVPDSVLCLSGVDNFRRLPA